MKENINAFSGISEKDYTIENNNNYIEKKEVIMEKKKIVFKKITKNAILFSQEKISDAEVIAKESFKKINKKEFVNLKEENIIMATLPGRMGDEDGSFIVIKNNNKFSLYRIDGWMYRIADNSGDYISINDFINHFPKLGEIMENRLLTSNEKYEHINMGFGNGLCIDKSIYDEYYKYLIEEVKRNKKYNASSGDNFSSALYYSSWLSALSDYTKAKKNNY